MKVILLQDIKRLGRRNEVKEVSDGYAANFLFPKKLAAPATNTALAHVAKTRAQEAQELERLQTLKKRLEEEQFEAKLTQGAHGEVFKGLNKADILTLLKSKGFGDVHEIELERPIKSHGAHKVTIPLGKGIVATITLTAL